MANNYKQFTHCGVEHFTNISFTKQCILDEINEIIDIHNDAFHWKDAENEIVHFELIHINNMTITQFFDHIESRTSAIRLLDISQDIIREEDAEWLTKIHPQLKLENI